MLTSEALKGPSVLTSGGLKGRSVLKAHEAGALIRRRPEGDGVLFGQLEGFLVVARLGNLSRAAEEMFLTQPTLTARLKALEEEVGDELFVRTSRGMRLTEAGREFVPYAERVMGGFEEGKRRMEELREASGGRLRIGASPGVGTYA